VSDTLSRKIDYNLNVMHEVSQKKYVIYSIRHVKRPTDERRILTK